MGLNNSQYDAIMRRYSLLQSENQRQLQQRRSHAYQLIPELVRLDDEVSSASLARVRSMLESADTSSSDNERSDYLKTMKAIAQKRASLLAAHSLPENYLDLWYHCPDCQDSGYQNGQKCHCFRQAVIDYYYTQSGLKDILAVENFDHFTSAYYPQQIKGDPNSKNVRSMMEEIASRCRAFAADFDHDDSNLFFYGGTGLGKTFLSHCIAKELIESSHSVIYYSANDLFDLLARESFGKTDTDTSMREYIFDCDLLIIDDLGTELTNSFVASALFLLLNERISRKKNMIISTNLPLANFSDLYSERVFSRIIHHFQLYQFLGNDIRILKKLQANKKEDLT